MYREILNSATVLCVAQCMVQNIKIFVNYKMYNERNIDTQNFQLQETTWTA